MADARVALFALGGTIAMGPDASGGVVPSLSPAQLVAAVPHLDAVDVELEVEEFRRLPGASLGFGDLAELAERIEERLAGGADGVVVTQGTDTIEESAYYLDLVHRRPEPVVVTGAMRNPGLAGADGPANLLAAIEVASSPTSRQRGCLVVMNDEVHAARAVCKAHSSSPSAFQSPTSGPAGHVVGGSPYFHHPAGRRLVVPPDTTTDGRGPRVALAVMAFGDGGEMLDGLAGRVDGVVVAGFGVGHVPAALAGPLGDLAAKVPVVLTSRAAAGPVALSTYSFPGSESDLYERGLIPGGFLGPFKARVLLHLLLASGADRATIADALWVAGGYRDVAGWPWPAP